MNGTTTDTTALLNERVNGIGYFIGVSCGVIFLIAGIAFASFFCNRILQSRSQLRRSLNNTRNNPSLVLEVGLDEKTLQSYRTLRYSQAKLNKKETCCSICLSDYKNTDALRQLPDCGHLFHVKCVDPWLRLHITCPVCRKSPLPTPISTPLVEAVPLLFCNSKVRGTYCNNLLLYIARLEECLRPRRCRGLYRELKLSLL